MEREIDVAVVVSNSDFRAEQVCLAAANRVVRNPFAERQRFLLPDVVIQNAVDLRWSARPPNLEVWRLLSVEANRREQGCEDYQNCFLHSYCLITFEPQLLFNSRDAPANSEVQEFAGASQ